MTGRLAAISCLALLGAGLLWASPAAAQLMNSVAGWSYIATVNATGATTLRFTGANWSNKYNTLFVNCEGLLVSVANDAIDAYIGEGSPVTWQGDGPDGNSVSSYASTQDLKNTGAGDLFDGNWQSPSTAYPASLKFFINNPGSSTAYKMVYVVEYGFGSSTTNGGESSDLGWWTADTNPLTGFELEDGDGGNIKAGTCSLYGMY
jgi:hypothetical protein